MRTLGRITSNRVRDAIDVSDGAQAPELVGSGTSGDAISDRAVGPHPMERFDLAPRTGPVWGGPCALAATLATAIGFAGVRGADYPAHEFRAELWRQAPGSMWNFAWYGGHATPPYGVLSPPVVAVFGTFLTVAVATVLATVAFTSLVQFAFPRRVAVAAGCAFAVTATTNVVVGRVAFGLGLMLGLLTLLAWHHRAVGWVLVGAVATSLASPVAGACLVVCAAAVVAGALLAPGTGARRVDVVGVLLVVLAAAPVLATSLLFGGEGRFPFRAGHAVLACAVLVAIVVFVDRREVRIACWLALPTTMALFVAPNAMGGNVVRLPQIVGVPLLVAGVLAVRPSNGWSAGARWGCLVVALAWSLSPAVVAAAAWHDDPSVDREFHAPLVEQVVRRNATGDAGRLEIPFTVNHWEAAWVAPEVPYARGWERQLDLVRNPELYEPGLDAGTYRAWLDRNAVRWIAIPSTRIDHGGRAEARVVAAAEQAGAAWLHRVWESPDWVLYEVDDHRPIVGGGVLVRFDLTGMVVAFDAPGTAEITTTPSGALSIWPTGCLAAGDDDVLRATVARAGVYRISSATWDARRSQSSDCESP